MISCEQAMALRRLMLLAAGLTATLVAHEACSSGMGLTRGAPFVWGSMGCLAIFAVRRRTFRWSEWSRLGVAVRLVVLELALHAVLTEAPWAFGVTVHHTSPLLGTATLVAHGAAAAVLAVVLIGAQRLLTALQRLVTVLRRALRTEPVRHTPRPMCPVAVTRAPAWPLLRLRGARAPPVAAS
jgi:hypothetical protein